MMLAESKALGPKGHLGVRKLRGGQVSSRRTGE
jgi:hypothetical protein